MFDNFFYLPFTRRLAGFASFNIKCLFRSHFVGAFWYMSWPDFDVVLCCIRMLPLDIHYMTLLNTTLMVPNYIRRTITCANPHILSHERILFAVISTRNLLMQQQKLFFRVNLILFLSIISWLYILSETDIISLLL